MAVVGSLFGEVWTPRVQARCCGTDSLVIAKECIRLRGGPEICLPYMFSPKQLCLGARAQLEWWGACTCCSLVASQNPFSQPFLLPPCCNSDDCLQPTVNFSAASRSAHWLPLCFNGHPSFLFMSLILTPGPLPLPFCLLNRCFFFFLNFTLDYYDHLIHSNK